MKIVVTGGAGRIGSYVAREVAAAGHEVVVFDRNPPAPGSPGRWMAGDVDEFGDVVGALKGADAVAHLAAIPIPDGVPDHTLFRTNVLGTYHVHEAAALHGIRRVVCASSSAVLGWAYREREIEPRYLPVDEDHPAAAQDVYGMAKVCEEQIGHAFAARCDMETIALRFPRVVTTEAAVELWTQGGVRPSRFDLYPYIDVRDAAAPSATHWSLRVSSMDHCLWAPTTAPALSRCATRCLGFCQRSATWLVSSPALGRGSRTPEPRMCWVGRPATPGGSLLTDRQQHEARWPGRMPDWVLGNRADSGTRFSSDGSRLTAACPAEGDHGNGIR